MDDAKQVVLTLEALRAALTLGRIEPGAMSPLSSLEQGPASGAGGAETLGLLREVLWLTGDDPPKLTPEALRALRAVAAPQVVAGALVGSPYAIATTSSYAETAWAPGALVSFDLDPAADRAVFIYPQSPQHLLDLVLKQVVPVPTLGDLPFTARMEAPSFVTLLCVLDWQMHCQLQARLEREPLAATRVQVGDLWRMLVEGRAAVDLGWMVSAFAYLMPMLDFELEDAQLEEATHRIAEMGWLQPDGKGCYAIAEELEELGNALLPAISFAALNLARRTAEGEWRQTHLVLVQGMAVLLLLQPVLEEGRQTITVDSVKPDELLLLLQELTMEAEAAAPAGAPLACPNCQAPLQAVDRFCRQCGQAVPSDAAQPAPSSAATCTRCGNRVPPEARFCSYCGAALAGAEE